MPALVLPHLEERPAHEWLDSLRHNQQASQGGLISKITVADVVDRAAGERKQSTRPVYAQYADLN